MQEVYVEFVGGEVVVYCPGTAEAVVMKPSLEAALAYARTEWPDLGVRVMVSRDAREMLAQPPPTCPHGC